MLRLILLTGLALGSIASGPTTLVKLKVPLKYTTTTQQIFSHHTDEKLFIANIDCPTVDGGEVTVCAELPENPSWDVQKSLVFLELYDLVRNIANVSLALNKTTQGWGKAPKHCASVKSWPGGDLFIKAFPGVAQPVSYSLGVTVTPLSSATRVRRAINHAQAGNLQSGDIEQLVPFATYYKGPTMEYGHTLLLEMELCAGRMMKYDMITTVMSIEGTFAHYICDGPCQAPGDRSVVCTVCNTGLPACICSYKTQPGMDKVYVMVYAAGGNYNPSDRKYEAKFKFGAAFHIL